jgi:hypothetical protein
MHAIRKLLALQLGSDLFVGKVAQIASYVVAVGFLALSAREIAMLKLTEEQLFFGILLVLAVFLLIIYGGMLARIDAELTKKDGSR